MGPSILADLFVERYYATAMAFYALCLSAGSLVGPLIAGYLVLARGWRWFFTLCAILAVVNLVMTFFLLPETLYEPGAETRTLILSSQEKDTGVHLEEYRDDGVNSWRARFSLTYSEKAKEKGVLKHWFYVFWLPLPMVLNPGVLIASLMYGVVLGW